MSDPALSFQGLGHAYRPDRWIFRNYSGQIKRGSIFALLGPNGCGKTTLLRVLIGALPPSTGRVETRGRTAFVPQLFQVSFDYSVLDMVLMGRARQIRLFAQPSASDEAAARAALDRFGMLSFASRAFHELSGGERQLVIFARAVVSQPDILILDEPTSALDLKNQNLILYWLTRLGHEDGLTVLFTTHNPNHASAVADEALLMLGESEYVCGPTGETLSESNLQSLYGIQIKLLPYEHESLTHHAFVPVLPSSRGTKTDKF